MIWGYPNDLGNLHINHDSPVWTILWTTIIPYHHQPTYSFIHYPRYIPTISPLNQQIWTVPTQLRSNAAKSLQGNPRSVDSQAWHSHIRGFIHSGCIYVYARMYMYIHMNAYIYIYISMNLYVNIPIHHIKSIYQSFHPSIDPSISLSTCLSIYLSIYLSIHLSIYPCIYLSICLSIYLSI